MASPIVFRILLTRETGKDDVIRITPINGAQGDDYLVQYNDTDSKASWVTRMTYDQVGTYLDTLAASLRWDDIDPYTSVNVQFPFFPTLAMSTYEYSTDRFQRRLCEMFDFVMETYF
jgi:hypothetical protein